MKALVIGGGAVALLLVAGIAAAAKKKPSPSGSSTSPTPAKPSPGGIVGQGGAGTAPEYLSSVPYVIAMRVISMSDPSLQQSQGVWLSDNGYPKTGEAVQKFARGEITDIELRQIAQAEFKAKPPTIPTTTTKPKGTTAADPYGTWVLANGTDDEVYSYGLTATSIPFVTQAAARLAAAGDSRAAALTQHLVDITV